MQKKSFIKIGSSETLRAVCSEKISNINTRAKGKNLSTLQYSYWLAGLIDSRASLICSVEGKTRCEISVGEKQLNILYSVKNRMGGSIKLRTKEKEYRWRLHKKAGMLQLIEQINGKLHLPKRQSQLKQVCAALQLEYLPVKQISEKNGWIAGFYEGEGLFHVNLNSHKCSINLRQKQPLLLEQISLVLPGCINYDKNTKEWLYSAVQIADLFLWVNYFSVFPLRSYKQIQLKRFQKILLFKKRSLTILEESMSLKGMERFERLLQEFSRDFGKNTIFEQEDIVHNSQLVITK